MGYAIGVYDRDQMDVYYNTGEFACQNDEHFIHTSFQKSKRSTPHQLNHDVVVNTIAVSVTVPSWDWKNVRMRWIYKWCPYLTNGRSWVL